ncbi:MAG: ABC transporter ATP-binding protein [Salinirussus sp.]
MPALEAEGLTRSFGPETAVDRVSFALREGEFFTLIGPSGCGKTTTLRMLAGLTSPDAGTVRIDGELATDRPARTRATNMVFQDLVLFPHMTVAENVGYGLRRSGVGADERIRRVEEALGLVDLGGFGDRDPAELSGGQRQRVALARALANDPAVLLLDEPLASLDRALREEMQSEFRRIQRDAGTTFLYVTHDQESAMSMSDRMAVMRDGRIVDAGAPRRLYDRPANAFVAEFLGEATVLTGRVLARDGHETRVETPAGEVTAVDNGVAAGPGETVGVVVRPEGTSVGDGPATGEVVDAAYKGFYEEATVELADGSRLVVRSRGGEPGREPEREGETAVPTDGGDPDDEARFRVGDAVDVTVERAVLVADDRDGGEHHRSGA